MALPFRTTPVYAKYGQTDAAETYGGSIVNLVEIPSPVGNGSVLATHTTDAMTHSVRIKDSAGTTFYLMATTTADNRGGGA